MDSVSEGEKTEEIYDSHCKSLCAQNLIIDWIVGNKEKIERERWRRYREHTEIEKQVSENHRQTNVCF